MDHPPNDDGGTPPDLSSRIMTHHQFRREMNRIRRLNRRRRPFYRVAAEDTVRYIKRFNWKSGIGFTLIGCGTVCGGYWIFCLDGGSTIVATAGAIHGYFALQSTNVYRHNRSLLSARDPQHGRSGAVTDAEEAAALDRAMKESLSATSGSSVAKPPKDASGGPNPKAAAIETSSFGVANNPLMKPVQDYFHGHVQPSFGDGNCLFTSLCLAEAFWKGDAAGLQAMQQPSNAAALRACATEMRARVANWRNNNPKFVGPGTQNGDDKGGVYGGEDVLQAYTAMENVNAITYLMKEDASARFYVGGKKVQGRADPNTLYLILTYRYSGRNKRTGYREFNTPHYEYMIPPTLDDDISDGLKVMVDDKAILDQYASDYQGELGPTRKTEAETYQPGVSSVSKEYSVQFAQQRHFPKSLQTPSSQQAVSSSRGTTSNVNAAAAPNPNSKRANQPPPTLSENNEKKKRHEKQQDQKARDDQKKRKDQKEREDQKVREDQKEREDQKVRDQKVRDQNARKNQNANAQKKLERKESEKKMQGEAQQSQPPQPSRGGGPRSDDQGPTPPGPKSDAPQQPPAPPSNSKPEKGPRVYNMWIVAAVIVLLFSVPAACICIGLMIFIFVVQRRQANSAAMNHDEGEPPVANMV